MTIFFLCFTAFRTLLSIQIEVQEFKLKLSRAELKMSKSDLALLVGIPIALTRRPWALQVSWRAGGSVGEVRRWGGASRDAASECKRPLTLRQLSTVSQIQQAPSISNYIYSKLKVKQQRRNVSQFALHTLIWVHIKLVT